MSLHIEKQKSGNGEYLRLISLRRMKSGNGRPMVGKKTVLGLGAFAKYDDGKPVLNASPNYYGLKMRLDPVSIVRSRGFQKSKWQSREVCPEH